MDTYRKQQIDNLRGMTDDALAEFLAAVESAHDYLWGEEKDHAEQEENDDDHHIYDDLVTIQHGTGGQLDHAEQDDEGQWFFVKYENNLAVSYGPYASRSAAIVAGGEL